MTIQVYIIFHIFNLQTIIYNIKDIIERLKRIFISYYCIKHNFLCYCLVIYLEIDTNQDDKIMRLCRLSKLSNMKLI